MLGANPYTVCVVPTLRSLVLPCHLANTFHGYTIVGDCFSDGASVVAANEYENVGKWMHIGMLPCSSNSVCGSFANIKVLLACDLVDALLELFVHPVELQRYSATPAGGRGAFNSGIGGTIKLYGRGALAI